MWIAVFLSGLATGVLASLSLLVYWRQDFPNLTQFLISLVHLKLHQRRTEKKLSLFKNLAKHDASPTDVGILPAPHEYQVENPIKKDIFQNSDGIQFLGVDSEQNLLDICINKVSDTTATVWLFLKLSKDDCYRLPFTEDARRAFIDNEYNFNSSGLQIKCLSPLRRWRVSFNGLLRKSKGKDDGSGDNVELVHVKFSFIWLSMSLVRELNVEFCAKEAAKAFANAGRNANPEDIKRFTEIQNRYEQWGQLMGTVTLKGSPERELYLWSQRTRILDKPIWMEDDFSIVKLFMYFKDGVPLKIECASIKDLISNYTDGYTIAGGGEIYNLANISLETKSMTHKLPSYPDKIQFHLRGQRRTLFIEYFEEEAHLAIGSDGDTTLFMKPFKVKLDGMVGGGIMHHVFRATEARQQSFFPPPMTLKEKKCIKEGVSLVLPLTSVSCESSQVSGGKGCSLSLLTKLSKKTNQFVVPKGLVITTSAFEHHISTNSTVQLAIHQLNSVSCERVSGDLKEECLKCIEEFTSSKLCEVLVSEIQSSLSSEFESFETVRYSVRSSACGEDSEDLSAAGQMLTVLGVRGLKGITDAIIQCWSSKFTFESVQYSRQNGQSIQSSMALVIQEMVPAETAGVMFTVDPVTGDPTFPYITANYGLGETVVSSMAEPDTIILRRDAFNNVSVAERTIGSKETQVFMTDGDGVEQKQVLEKSNCSCLSDDMAVKIGQVGLLIEDCFCGPRDIEFAVSGDTLYLLQARPITTLHNETDFELIHDQDNPVCSEQEYWTRANTGEVFSGATSPLAISLVAGAMDIYGQRGHILREKLPGVVFCPYFLHMLPATHKQITISLIDTIYKVNEKEINNNQLAFEVAIFGRVIADKKIHAAGVKKYGLMSKGIVQKSKVLILFWIMYRAPTYIRGVEEKVKKYRLPIETFTSAAKTWKGIMDQMLLYSEICAVHGLATMCSSIFNVMLISILSKNKKVWDNELYCDFANLLSSCTDVESADVPSSLQNLAKSVTETCGGDTFASLDSEAAYALLKNDTGPSGRLFKEFLEKHGHRCLKEFDLSSLSWGMKPEILIPTLQSMVKSAAVLKPKQKENNSVEAAISKVSTPMTSFTKWILKLILPWSRSGVGQREKTKSMVIKSVDWFRQSFHHLGRMMVLEGMLPRSDLVCFLTLDEIQEVLLTQRPGLVQRAIRRQRLQPKLEVLQFPEIIVGVPRPIKEETVPEQFSSTLVLHGTPVCQGAVRAVARVITSLEDAPTIQNGDILITHSTDIGWSPYFPLLSGVVTVLGGLISHGAVVAREYGLPCIVGVKGATKAFKSGDIVVLDGTKGTITKVEISQ